MNNSLAQQIYQIIEQKFNDLYRIRTETNADNQQFQVFLMSRTIEEIYERIQQLKDFKNKYIGFNLNFEEIRDSIPNSITIRTRFNLEIGINTNKYEFDYFKRYNNLYNLNKQKIEEIDQLIILITERLDDFL